MKLIYVGPHDEVRVPLAGGGETLVKSGAELDTTDTHGRSLLAQPDNWQPVKPPKLAPAEKGAN
jgi:hypothetical protein